ncbi:MAG: hypothetical protein AB1Z98_32415 [Nannocystaceae bacterium]
MLHRSASVPWLGAPSRGLVLVVLLTPLLGCDGNGTLPPVRELYEGQPPVALECVPNLDGRIDADEVPLVLGASVSYLVSPPGVSRAVDVAGLDEGGLRVWDWSVDLADDQLLRVGPQPIDDRWYADRFPPDAFVAPFDGGGAIETVSRQDDQGLQLLGLASAQPDPAAGRTLLVYDAPVELLRFPIEPGTSFSAVGTVTDGTFRGIPYAATDTYDVSVDALGELRLPSLTFTQAHRVRTTLTVEPALGEITSVRQVSYFFECFGEVARATSQPNEPETNFTEAAEIRRLGY